MPDTIADSIPREKHGETRFGVCLQAIRKARGLTQVKLAEAAGTVQGRYPSVKPKLVSRRADKRRTVRAG